MHPPSVGRRHTPPLPSPLSHPRPVYLSRNHGYRLVVPSCHDEDIGYVLYSHVVREPVIEMDAVQ